MSSGDKLNSIELYQKHLAEKKKIENEQREEKEIKEFADECALRESVNVVRSIHKAVEALADNVKIRFRIIEEKKRWFFGIRKVEHIKPLTIVVDDSTRFYFQVAANRFAHCKAYPHALVVRLTDANGQSVIEAPSLYKAKSTEEALKRLIELIALFAVEEKPFN